MSRKENTEYSAYHLAFTILSPLFCLGGTLTALKVPAAAFFPGLIAASGLQVARGPGPIRNQKELVIGGSIGGFAVGSLWGWQADRFRMRQNPVLAISVIVPLITSLHVVQNFKDLPVN
eukprot:TRINITY_DN7104_c0_g1_i4.p1 TRINITY_DN7104_c0_g1~~TRINITY_DN7104_c0_g1_i4.p1  ORF type:complete len:119 (+),score=13.44 TRINITY_DN7104_c0_g1_i4:62-418(+)